jgi:hypothetical protein
VVRQPFGKHRVCEIQSAPPFPRRWYRLTPGQFVLALAAFEVLLCLSARYRWFAFSKHQGWTVLIAVAAVAAVVLVILAWFAVALFFGRRLQFSIRSLLLLTVAVAIPFSWLVQSMREARWQREAVTAIRSPGYVVYDWQCDCDGQVMPIADEPQGPAWLWGLLGGDFFSEVSDVNMDSPTDADLRHLERIRGIQYLYFGGNRVRITDAGLERLYGLSQLRELNLTCADDVSDEGVRRLQQTLPNCRIMRPLRAGQMRR